MCGVHKYDRLSPACTGQFIGIRCASQRKTSISVLTRTTWPVTDRLVLFIILINMVIIYLLISHFYFLILVSLLHNNNNICFYIMYGTLKTGYTFSLRIVVYKSRQVNHRESLSFVHSVLGQNKSGKTFVGKPVKHFFHEKSKAKFPIYIQSFIMVGLIFFTHLKLKIEN